MALVETLLDLELPSLSDRELAALDGGRPADRVVELPGVDTLDADAYVHALSEGLRSLLDRGYLSTAAEPLEPPRVGAEIETILAARSLPAFVAVAERVHHGARSSRYVYGVEPGVVLTEKTTHRGLHRFRLCAASLAAERLQSFVDPRGRASHDGELLNARFAIECAVGTPDTLTRVFAARRPAGDGPTEWEATIAASGSGLWLIAEADEAAGSVAARTLSAGTARLLLERLLVPGL